MKRFILTVSAMSSLFGAAALADYNCTCPQQPQPAPVFIYNSCEVSLSSINSDPSKNLYTVYKKKIDVNGHVVSLSEITNLTVEQKNAVLLSPACN